MNVLDAIQLLIKAEGKATRATIKQVAPELSHRHIAQTIVENSEHLKKGSRGSIVGTHLRRNLKDQLWNSGKFYKVDTFGAWSVEGECLKFKGREDLEESLASNVTIGALGDCWDVKVIRNTPENRAALERAGLSPWEDVEIDDRLWVEPPRPMTEGE